MKKRTTKDTLLRLVESFFREHLQRVRGASPNTILAYRDSLSLFFRFLADLDGRRISKLTVEDVDPKHVLAFLDHLESERHNSVATRNCRLAAIRSFTEHLLRHDPMRAGRYQQILAIPSKKAPTPTVMYLEPNEVEALIGQVDIGARTGLRDHVLMLFLYNTGARVSEALAVSRSDLELNRPAHVRLHGKGDKDRVCPLWKETAQGLASLLETNPRDEGPIFRNNRGQTLTRDGVAYVLRKHVRAAARQCSSFKPDRVTPHVLRHSCAVALLQAGIDVVTIRDYLGHASVATTNRYITTNLKMKREALEAFWKHAGLIASSDSKPTRWKPSADLLAFLSSL